MLHDSNVIWATRESIGDDVALTVDILDDEVEVRESILPSRLTTAEHRLRRKVLQGFMIGHHLELHTREVMAPRCESLDDRKQLLFMNGIACRGILHLLRHEGDGLQSASLILLQHSTGCES